MTDLTIEDILSEMESEIELLSPRLDSDVDIEQLMARWNCGWNVAKRRGNQLTRTGKWEWVKVIGSHGRRILVLRKPTNGKTKKR
jgi:hypothetical protein